MKMNYHHKSKTKSKKLLYSSLLTIVGLFFLYSFSVPVESFLKKSFQDIAYPFWKSKAFVSDRFFVLGSFFKSRGSIIEENEELKRKLMAFEIESNNLDLLRKENNQLRDLLNRGEDKEVLPAFILSRPPQMPYDIFLIDIGQNSNLKGGEDVYFKNIILGKVIKVFEKTAQVRISSSGGLETDAFIERLNLPVKVTGKGNGNFESKLPQEVDVEIGDVLIVPGEHGKLLGQIEEVERNPSSSFIKILLRLPVNLSEIRWVSVQIL